MNCGRTWPICSMDLCVARGIVSRFTLGNFLLLVQSWNDRSRITHKVLLLCGTAARGETFKFWWWLCLMSSQLMIHTVPWLNFSMASAQRSLCASRVLAEGWFPCWITASKWSCIHGTLQSTGHPCMAYSSRMVCAGWCLVCLVSCMQPMYTGWYLL